MRPQPLGDGQRQVGGRRAGWQAAGQAHTDDLRQHHDQRLAEHRGFGLDSADPPSEDAQAVDHRRVGIGADERVGESQGPVVGRAMLHDRRQILEVDLVDDPGGRWDDAEVGEGLLPPAEKTIALLVALELEIGVATQRLARGEEVDLQRVIDDQVDREARVDPARIAAEASQGGAHRRQIDHGRHAGEVLHQDTRRKEGDLRTVGQTRCPGGNGPDVLAADALFVDLAQDRLEQEADRERQPVELRQAGLLERRQAEDGHLAGLRRQTATGQEGVVRHQPLRCCCGAASGAARAAREGEGRTATRV